MPIVRNLPRNEALPGILSGVWCCDTILGLDLRIYVLLIDTVRPWGLLDKVHETLTAGWRLIRLLDHHHSFTNLLSLGPLQGEGYSLASFCRRHVSPFPLYALDGSGVVVSVGVRSHPERGISQRQKATKKRGDYITESPTLTLPPPTIPLTTVPTNGTDQTSVIEY